MFFYTQLIFISYRDASLRELRANSTDLARIGSCNENLNSLVNRDRETDFNQQNGKNNCGGEAPRFQSGVLRTNCIDCLDRTNVAQYAYGLAALGRQLYAMGLTDIPKVDPESTIAAALMDMYQSMGDALAQQYGGSEAHNTVSFIENLSQFILHLSIIKFAHLHFLFFCSFFLTMQMRCCFHFLNHCFVMSIRSSQRGKESGKLLPNLESF